MTVRVQIADRIKADNPAFDVAGFARSAPENLGAGKVRVSVFREELTPASPNVLTHSITVQLMVGGQFTASTEDNAEAALDAVLLSVQRLDGVRFLKATRVIYDEKWVGFNIDLEADSTNIYRTTVLSERA